MEFKAGGKVKCAFFGDEVFELKYVTGCRDIYPLTISRLGSYDTFTIDGRSSSMHTHPILILVERKKEPEVWFRVTSKAKADLRPYENGVMVKTEEDFLGGRATSDFEWIHLEQVYPPKEVK